MSGDLGVLDFDGGGVLQDSGSHEDWLAAGSHAKRPSMKGNNAK